MECEVLRTHDTSYGAGRGKQTPSLSWLPTASGGICGVVACLALAVRFHARSATVPASWLVTWVVYSAVACALSVLASSLNTPRISEFFQGAGINALAHVLVMAVFIFQRERGTNRNEQARPLPPTRLDASAQTAVLSAELTCWEGLFLATVGRVIQLVDLAIWIVSLVGIDLAPFFFPLPFFQFYHARLLTSHYRIQGARVHLSAGYSDAYFLYLQEKMLNFLTLTAYRRCMGETYPKWLDSKLQWVGAPPRGYNNHFRIFFNTGTLCERVHYYVVSTLLFTLFGWLPFFRPIYLWWHYKQMVQRLVIGGAKATLDDGYTVCSFFGVYLGSCCGCCCGHRILVFVDRHLHLEPAGIEAEEGEREMGAIFGLSDSSQNNEVVQNGVPLSMSSPHQNSSSGTASAWAPVVIESTAPVASMPEDPAVVSLQQVRVDENTGKCVKFNRGPQGNVGIGCEKLLRICL